LYGLFGGIQKAFAGVLDTGCLHQDWPLILAVWNLFP